jgi:hypothetical protein
MAAKILELFDYNIYDECLNMYVPLIMHECIQPIVKQKKNLFLSFQCQVNKTEVPVRRVSMPQMR